MGSSKSKERVQFERGEGNLKSSEGGSEKERKRKEIVRGAK